MSVRKSTVARRGEGREGEWIERDSREGSREGVSCCATYPAH